MVVLEWKFSDFIKRRIEAPLIIYDDQYDGQYDGQCDSRCDYHLIVYKMRWIDAGASVVK